MHANHSKVCLRNDLSGRNFKLISSERLKKSLWNKLASCTVSINEGNRATGIKQRAINEGKNNRIRRIENLAKSVRPSKIGRLVIFCHEGKSKEILIRRAFRR